MKYWLLTSEFPPFFGGGISTYCVHTARMLQQQGHEVSVFVYDNRVRNTQVDLDSNIRIVRFAATSTNTQDFLGYSTQLSYEYAAVVKRFIEKEGNPDIIESQEYLGIAYYLLQFRWLGYNWCKDLKVVITAHSPAFLYLPQNHISTYKYPLFWIGEMERFCLKAADLVISPTRFLLDAIQKDTALKDLPTAVVPNPFLLDAKQVSSPAEQIELVLVAKLSVQKGTFRVLEYMQQVWKQRPEIRLTLLGDDSIVYHPEQRTMGDLVRKRYATDIDAGRLKLLSKRHSSEYADTLRNASVALVPSVFDNLPYVALEMMALGKLVLASKQGGQSEIFNHGQTGFLFDHALAGDFENQLNQILALSQEDRTKVLIKAKESLTSTYSYEEVYKQKWALLQSVQNRVSTSKKYPFIRVGEKKEEFPETGNDLLSIVVTFYNSGIYLQQIVDNLAQVDYPNREIIIVDDGSTDPDSIAALENLAGREDIRVVSQKNSGLGASRNRGAREAKGTYLTFIDADDMIASDYYSKAVAVLSTYDNVHAVGAWTRYFEGSEKVWPTFQPEPPILLYHNVVNSAALVFKRRSFLDAGGNDVSMIFPGLEDYELIIRLAGLNMGVVVLPEVLFNYRVRTDSMVRGINPYKRKLINEYIRAKHQELYSIYAVQLLNLEAMNGPAHLIDNPSLDYDFADKLPVGGRLAVKLAAAIKRNKYLRPIAYRIYKMIN